MNIKAAFDRYRIFLEGLTAENLYQFNEYVSPDVRFRDPFHDISGTASMKAVFQNLFDKVSGIQFHVINFAIRGKVVFFQWQLSGILYGRSWTVEGVTSITFNEDEKVSQHVEYWDVASQIYERFPIIGPLMRFFRRRISGAKRTIQ